MDYFEGEFLKAKTLIEAVIEEGDTHRTARIEIIIFLMPVLVSLDLRTEAAASADRHEQLCRELGEHRTDFAPPHIRSMIALAEGNPVEGLRIIRDTLAHTSAPMWRAICLPQQVDCELGAGLLDDARTSIKELLAVGRALMFPFTVAQGDVLVARLQRRLHEPGEAERAAHRALAAAAALPAKAIIVDALEVLAGTAVDLESQEEGARLLGAASSIRDRTGYRRCISERDADLAKLRTVLGPERFERAYNAGTQLTLDGAVSYAQRGWGERKRPSSGWASLSPAELQVVHLVKDGLTNAQIAEQLFISPRTVQSHLTHVFAKVGTASRTELGVAAAKRFVV